MQRLPVSRSGVEVHKIRLADPLETYDGACHEDPMLLHRLDQRTITYPCFDSTTLRGTDPVLREFVGGFSGPENKLYFDWLIQYILRVLLDMAMVERSEPTTSTLVATMVKVASVDDDNVHVTQGPQKKIVVRRSLTNMLVSVNECPNLRDELVHNIDMHMMGDALLAGVIKRLLMCDGMWRPSLWWIDVANQSIQHDSGVPIAQLSCGCVHCLCGISRGLWKPLTSLLTFEENAEIYRFMRKEGTTRAQHFSDHWERYYNMFVGDPLIADRVVSSFMKEWSGSCKASTFGCVAVLVARVLPHIPVFEPLFDHEVFSAVHTRLCSPGPDTDKKHGGVFVVSNETSAKTIMVQWQSTMQNDTMYVLVVKCEDEIMRRLEAVLGCCGECTPAWEWRGQVSCSQFVCCPLPETGNHLILSRDKRC